MFFRNVVGKVQLYPYLHVVTWSLPKRYLGLLRIFNLPLEGYPQQFITRSSEQLNCYELQVTKKSISQPQSEISPDDLAVPKSFNKSKLNDYIELDQATSGDSVPPRRRGRRSKKKPVISIRVKLNDDLRRLRSINGKSFEKILSRCSKKSCLLVIEKSKSKHDEVSLNFINSSNMSKPYSKLLKKNHRKKETFPSTPYSILKQKQSSSSEFCEESIYPPMKMKTQFFSEPQNQISNYNPPTNNSESSETMNIVKTKIKHSRDNTNQISKDVSINTTNEDGKCQENTQLTVPSHLIPYEKPIREEKPLRHWPVITQLFDKDHLDIYRNYLKSLSSPNDEEEPLVEKPDDDIISFNLNEVKAFHEAIKKTSLDKNGNEAKIKTETSEFNETQNIFGKYSKSEDEGLKTERNNANGTYWSSSNSITENPVKYTNYFVVNEKASAENDSQNLYTSTAYLLVGGSNEKSDKKEKTSFDDEKCMISNSDSNSLVNTRLLSSTVKTYESIKKNENKNIDLKKSLNKDIIEKTKKTERKLRGLRRLYFFNVVLALFVTVVLGVILFISFADNSTVKGFVEKYIRI